MSHDPNRRFLTLGLVGAAGAAVTRSAFAQPQPQAGGACLTLMPRTTEGPFYFDPKLVRSDITEGRPGAPVKLRLQLIEAAACTPLRGARIDIWHTDAAGQYSGYPGQADSRQVDTTGKTFMRGTQITDAEGRVQFVTVYPGWYQGRTTHIHFKALLDQANLVTGQLFFPDVITQTVYASRAEYRRPRRRETLNTNDGIALSAGRAAVADVKEEAGQYLVSLGIGVSGRRGGGRA